MNKVFLYDGSFSSLITLIVTLLNDKIEPTIIANENNYIKGLFDEVIYLKPNYKKEKIAYLINKTSKQVLICCYYVFLSNHNNKENIIYSFIKNALIYKNSIFYRRNIESVNETIKLQKRVSMEAHHMKGFLRFKKMKNNFYFAKINPTNNVIFLITKHFVDRLRNESFVIKDANRGIYAVYDNNKIMYLKEEDIVSLNLKLDDEEEKIQDLWKLFFKTIAIKERENLKNQISFMPKKYWENIIEMEVK